MKISLSILSYLLPEVELTGQVAPQREVKCILLYQGEAGITDRDAIYIISGEDQAELSERTLKGTIIALSCTDLEHCRRICAAAGCGALAFPDGMSVAEVHSRLMWAMMSYYEWLNRIDERMYRCSNVQELFDIASDKIKAPMLAWNPAFELMACANTDGLSEDEMPALMRRFLKGRGWSGEDVDTMIKKHDYLTMPMRYVDVRLLTPPNMMNCYSAVRNFSLHGRIVMTAGAYYLDGKPPHDGEVELLKVFFGRVMRYFEMHSDAYAGSKKIYERFILELIEGKLTKEADIMDRLSYLNFPYAGEFEVIVISCRKNVQPMALGIVRNYCKSYFRHTKFIEYRNHLVGLNNRLRDSDQAIERRADMFSDSNNLNDFNLGISSAFSCLRDTEAAFSQAKIALIYGQKLRPHEQYYRYDILFPYYMLSQVCGPGNSLGCPDARYIYQLRDMDKKKKGVDNEKLFVTYVLSGCNTAKAAEEMNLHRNSILYRIKQIETMLNINLSDPEVLFHMMLGIKAVELEEAENKAAYKEYSNEKL